MPERMENGVKVRADGRGDAWANEHREALGNNIYLQDLDALFGQMAFAQNTGDRLFLEYVPDDYSNRQNVVRKFQVVGMFDRKASLATATSKHNTVSTAFYLWLCRIIGEQQDVKPRFFYVFGKTAPWSMLELDIETGSEVGEPFTINDWRSLWSQLGLTEARRTLAAKIADVKARATVTDPFADDADD